MPGKAGNGASMKRSVDAGVPIGISGYNKGRPVACCSIAPCESYRTLVGNETVA